MRKSLPQELGCHTPSASWFAMTTTTDSRIAAIAALQHSVFSRAQVIGCGGDDALIRRRMRTGAWMRIHPGVYCIAGAPDSYERQMWAAFLAIGSHATITHESALYVHGSTACLDGR